MWASNEDGEGQHRSVWGKVDKINVSILLPIRKNVIGKGSLWPGPALILTSRSRSTIARSQGLGIKSQEQMVR